MILFQNQEVPLSKKKNDTTREAEQNLPWKLLAYLLSYLMFCSVFYLLYFVWVELILGCPLTSGEGTTLAFQLFWVYLHLLKMLINLLFQINTTEIESLSHLS